MVFVYFMGIKKEYFLCFNPLLPVAHKSARIDSMIWLGSFTTLKILSWVNRPGASSIYLCERGKKV